MRIPRPGLRARSLLATVENGGGEFRQLGPRRDAVAGQLARRMLRWNVQGPATQQQSFAKSFRVLSNNFEFGLDCATSAVIRPFTGHAPVPWPTALLRFYRGKGRLAPARIPQTSCQADVVFF